MKNELLEKRIKLVEAAGNYIRGGDSDTYEEAKKLYLPNLGKALSSLAIEHNEEAKVVHRSETGKKVSNTQQNKKRKGIPPTRALFPKVK
ncbi:MAG: hypothetical protein HGB35_06140 [Geobacteraceae bacterium]|nr:hypothetical protein [Geobacteraceae bacterium]